MIYKGQELDEFVTNKRSLKTKHSDLQNKTFRNWYVICRAPSNERSHIYYWCECSCGTIKTISAHTLFLSSKNKSNGCAKCMRKRSKKFDPVFCGAVPITYMNRMKRKINVDVTIEYINELYLKQNKKCAITGIPIDFCVGFSVDPKGRNRKQWRHTASIDRIDSTKDYSRSNIQLVHKDVNIMKNKFEEKYFYEMCKLVVKTLGVKYE